MQPRNRPLRGFLGPSPWALAAVDLRADPPYMATITVAKKSKKHPKTVTIGPGGPWHPCTPRRVLKAYRSRLDPRGWTAWCKHLARRKSCPLDQLLPGKRSPWTWALPQDADLAPTLKLIALVEDLDASARRIPGVDNAVMCWLSGAALAPASAAFGLECLAWCGALPRLSAHLPEPLWWELFDRLTTIAGRDGASGDDPLATQLLFGELPLALAYSFAELEDCLALAEVGRRTLCTGAGELLDGEGLLHAKHLHLLRPLLACWTRCKALGQELSCGCWNEEAERQYHGLVQHALRLTRTQGQQVFAATKSPRWNVNLLKAALRLSDDRTTERLFRLFENPSSRKARRTDLPSPAFAGEWAGLAVLRPDWQRSSPQLTVAYGSRQMLMELSVGPKCLWSGAWDFEVRFNDQPLAALGNWEQVCWESDDDVDYLELSERLSDEVSVERHILLARKERVLFLADAVLAIQPGTIEYRGTLPLAGFSTFQGEAQTREGTLLLGQRPQVRVLPLALNEWRSTRSHGNLQATARGLELTQMAVGESLFAPLFFDLDAGRLRKEATWRQLTVGQEREIVPSDVAVGYRAQAGKSQWLVYRSLSAPDIRTVLGKNLMHEFLFGQFLPNGKVETLLEIE